MTRHYTESNINILFTRNFPFDSNVRKWSYLFMIPIVCGLNWTIERVVKYCATIIWGILKPICYPKKLMMWRQSRNCNQLPVKLLKDYPEMLQNPILEQEVRGEPARTLFLMLGWQILTLHHRFTSQQKVFWRSMNRKRKEIITDVL